MMCRQRYDERGAVAIMYALLAVVLLISAALAVDIGNAVARKSDVQGQADFAALAGASQLGAQTSGTVPAGVVQAVKDQLNANRPLNSDGTCRAETPCVQTTSQLTDGVLSNGEVRFCSGTSPAGCRKSGLQVVAPYAQVDFGFARILGLNGIDVDGTATVGLFSPMGVMPVYAGSGCDYGQQTITDPPTGQANSPIIPTLAYNTDTNDSVLDPASATPNQVPILASGPTATVMFTGTNFTNVTMVGFFPSDGGAAVMVNSFEGRTGTGNNLVWTTYGSLVQVPPLLPYTAGNNGAIRLPLPTAVQSSQQVWYIRVFGDKTTGNGPSQVVTEAWSAKGEAPAVRVGDPPLECAGTSSDGNFGTLKLERTDVSSQSDQLAMNMATQLQSPTTLAVHTQADATGLCADGINGAVVTDLPNPGQQPGTNCGDTDTGLPALATTSGLVSGLTVSGTYTPGRLAGHPTHTGCDPTGGSSDRTITFGNGNNAPSYTINNDTLSCFLTSGTTSLQEIASASYCSSAPSCAVLDESIFESPRFFFVPVLRVTPVSGGSNKYSIIDFRPAFITDETTTLTTIKGTHTASSENGLYQDGNEIRTVKVVFINIKALPDSTNGQVTTYLGVGPKIIRMID